MDASRLLLRAALESPHNQQFLLLSEACVPLYPAQVVWQQLASEQRSRVNACKGVRPTPVPCSTLGVFTRRIHLHVSLTALLE